MTRKLPTPAPAPDNDERIVTSRQALATAFERWEREAGLHPEQFVPFSNGTYGEACAAYLIELLEAKP